MQAIYNIIKEFEEYKLLNIIYPILKRSIDIITSLFLLLLFLPLLLVFAIIIFVQTKSNPIYVQKRGLTLNKYTFNIYKLRTLYPNKVNPTNANKNILIQSNYANSVIPIGSFLRRTGIDEIPQLINVLLGDMSLIGPRPLSIHDLKIIKNYMPSLYARRDALNVKPGISGYWQIFGYREKGPENLIECDEYYQNNKSFLLDIFLMVMTLPLMVFARHTDAIIRK